MFGRDSRREFFFGPKEPRLLAAPWFLLAKARAACDTIGGKLMMEGRGIFIRLCVRLGALGDSSVLIFRLITEIILLKKIDSSG